MRLILITLGLAAFLTLSQTLLGFYGPPPGGRFEDRVIRVTREAPAPETELTALSAPPTTLNAWRGEVAIVSLWATWCGICAEEMPTLQALAERYQGRGLSVVTVSIDDAPAEALVADYLRTRGYDLLPPLVDRDKALAQGVGLRGTPTTVIVDRFGQIVAAFEGRGPWADDATHAYLEALLKAGSAGDSRRILESPGA